MVIRQGIVPELNSTKLTITNKLGYGSFGDVYQGLLEDSNGVERKVAVKSLRPGSQANHVAALLRELHTLRVCGSHRHCVRVYGAITTTVNPQVVFGLCGRGDLFTIATQSPRCLERKNVYGIYSNEVVITFQMIFNILCGVANGLHYIHSRGILHRDIAARNILIDDNFNPRLSDFGFATLTNSHAEQKISQGISLPIRWAAPECVMNKVCSKYSDVWSFGTLIYEVISYGMLPWPDHTEEDIKQAMSCKRKPEPPHNIYFSLQQIMLSCWDYEPNHRPNLLLVEHKISQCDVLR